MITLWVPGLPIAQPRARASSVHGKIVVYGAASKHAIHDWKAVIRILASQKMDGRLPLSDRALQLEVCFYFPRTKDMVKDRKLSSQLIPHIKKPDCDNLVKGLKDALTGAGVWADDCLVSRSIVEKVWCSRSSLDPAGQKCGTLVLVSDAPQPQERKILHEHEDEDCAREGCQAEA